MLTIGQKLLAFEILGPLGVGGMGEVYRARDSNLDREVALKVLPSAVADDEVVRRRFAREAQSLAALDHPHVASIYGFHEADGLCFLALELVGGEDLAVRLERGPLSLDETRVIGCQVAEGLEAAHQAGIVHRDLKPANVRVTSSGVAKILDFGLAKLMSPTESAKLPSNSAATVAATSITREGTLLGTPAYMSPEQARGLPLDPRTDLWAFGCLLYECLTGKRAFDGPSVADVIAAVLGHEPDWQALPRGIPANVVALLRGCLEKELARRLDDLGFARSQLAATADADTATVAFTTSHGSMALLRAREACKRRDWPTAFDLLTEADRRDDIEPEGLELMAECARWLGRHDQIFDPLERAHAAHVARADRQAAVRTSLELCHANDDAGRQALATAWWERANELIGLIPEGPEHARHAWFEARAHGAQGDLEGQHEAAERALQLARRFGDRNVEALALIDLAHVATVRGEHQVALDFIRRSTSLAIGGEIDIYATGMVFCNAIWACRCRGEWHRAQEWTESSSRWVHRQQVDYFPGMCRVHRAEVLRTRGDLAAAEKECEAATRMVTRATPAYATFPWAELGEVRRRRGDMSGAMTAFQKALALGWDPQPGLALLLLQQGDATSAHRSIERVFHEPRPTMLQEDRTNLLGARVVIALAAGTLPVAEDATRQLEAMATRNATPWDVAVATQSRGCLQLVDGQTSRAVESLTRARQVWGELEAPFELGLTCDLLGQAFVAENDRARAHLEFQAAADVFTRIGAEFERQRVAEQLEALEASASSNSPRIAPASFTSPFTSSFRSSESGGRTVARRGARRGVASEPKHAGDGAAADPSEASPPADAAMTREGDTWSLDFQGRTIRLKHTRGLQYLARLLSQPGADCWAVDLAGVEGPVDGGDAGEVIDDEARRAYRERVEELEQELAAIDSATDPHGAERVRSELDAIARQLAAAVGLGGRARRTGSAVERARQRVTKGIRGAIRKIADQYPQLGRYLDLTIKTGTACRFDPDRAAAVEWQVHF